MIDATTGWRSVIDDPPPAITDVVITGFRPSGQRWAGIGYYASDYIGWCMRSPSLPLFEPMKPTHWAPLPIDDEREAK